MSSTGRSAISSWQWPAAAREKPMTMKTAPCHPMSARRRPKAFDSVNVESHFKEDEVFWLRRFCFVADQEGVRDEELLPSGQPFFKTTINLDGFKSEYALPARHADATIARRIIEHCMIDFMSDGVPR